MFEKKGSDPSYPNKEGLRDLILSRLEVDEISDHDNLISCGLDSISIMLFVAKWKKLGIALKFSELLKEPTLSDWWVLISEQLPYVNHILDETIEVKEGKPFELAPMQQAYWIGSDESQFSSTVNAHYYIEFDGRDIDLSRLERAIKKLFSRHSMLRAKFLKSGHQQILNKTPWAGLTVNDCKGCSEDEQAEFLSGLRERLSHRKMNIFEGEVFDIQLTLLRNDACRIHFNIEMIVCDARSLQIILDDLSEFYKTPSTADAKLTYTFQHYISDREKQKSRSRIQARDYWAEKLHQMPNRPNLPFTKYDHQTSENTVGRRFYRFPDKQVQQLSMHCKYHEVTLSSVLMTVFSEVIGRWSEDTHFLLNIPLFERDATHPDVEKIVGDFTNLVIASIDVSENVAFVERIKNITTNLADDISYADYSGLEVLRDLARMRASDSIMAPVVFTSTLGMGDLYGDESRNCFGSPGWSISQTPQVWLDCQVTEVNDGILVNWDVAEKRFPATVIDAMFEAYIRVITSLSCSAESWLTNVDCLPASHMEVREQFTNQKNVTKALLHSGFFQRAIEQPENIALIDADGTKVTYQELAKQALSIGALLKEKGVVAGQLIAVSIRPSVEQIAAVLGILSVGGVYVPVNPIQPFERQKLIYDNAEVKFILAESVTIQTLPPLKNSVYLGVENALSYHPLSAIETVSNSELAYVIYTSGTTGKPKGVEITHQAAMNTIEDIIYKYDVTQSDCICALSSLEFDLSVFDIFGVLSVGASMVIVKEDDKKEAATWLKLIQQYQVTIWDSVPALLDMLLVANEEKEEHLSSLRLALISGDVIHPDLPKRLKCKNRKCQFVALGGATEAAIWSNFFNVDEVDDAWQSVPYGYPLTNQKFRIVDAENRDCPEWVKGEIWIGGKGLAKGYLNNQSLTKDKFVMNSGERWYRTGDCGRYLANGVIEILGRIDNQVKIMGHRIELGEIELVMEDNPLIERAIAFTDDERNKIYAAVICSGPGETLKKRDLDAYLSPKLPRYMRPEIVSIVQSFPLNSNGKVDRKSLIEIVKRQEGQQVGADEEKVVSPVENQVAKIWSEVLAVDKPLGSFDNFFLLGGNSITATRMIEMVRQQFSVDILLREFMDAQTISGVSVLVEDKNKGFDTGVI